MCGEVCLASGWLLLVVWGGECQVVGSVGRGVREVIGSVGRSVGGYY